MGLQRLRVELLHLGVRVSATVIAPPCAAMASTPPHGARPRPGGRSFASRLPGSWPATSSPWIRCGCDGCMCCCSSNWRPGGSIWPASPPSEWPLGHPAGPQPAAGTGRIGSTRSLRTSRPRREVHSQLRRRVLLRGWRGAGDPSPGAPSECLRGALGPHRPRRVPRLAADRRARPPRAGPAHLRPALQPPPSPPGAAAATARPAGPADHPGRG